MRCCHDFSRLCNGILGIFIGFFFLSLYHPILLLSTIIQAVNFFCLFSKWEPFHLDLMCINTPCEYLVLEFSYFWMNQNGCCTVKLDTTAIKLKAFKKFYVIRIRFKLQILMIFMIKNVHFFCYCCCCSVSLTPSCIQ